jgi:hypothetical protein
MVISVYYMSLLILPESSPVGEDGIKWDKIFGLGENRSTRRGEEQDPAGDTISIDYTLYLHG